MASAASIMRHVLCAHIEVPITYRLRFLNYEIAGSRGLFNRLGTNAQAWLTNTGRGQLPKVLLTELGFTEDDCSRIGPYT